MLIMLKREHTKNDADRDSPGGGEPLAVWAGRRELAVSPTKAQQTRSLSFRPKAAGYQYSCTSGRGKSLHQVQAKTARTAAYLGTTARIPVTKSQSQEILYQDMTSGRRPTM
jgi:hypothetical protein